MAARFCFRREFPAFIRVAWPKISDRPAQGPVAPRKLSSGSDRQTFDNPAKDGDLRTATQATARAARQGRTNASGFPDGAATPFRGKVSGWYGEVGEGTMAGQADMERGESDARAASRCRSAWTARST